MAKTTTTTTPKGTRLSGAERDKLMAQVKKRYEAGDSIRKIAEDSGRSFGSVQGLLKDSGAAVRSRGGATRGVKKSAAKKSPAKKSATKKTAKKS